MKKASVKIMAGFILLASVISNIACGPDAAAKAQAKVNLAYRYLDDLDYTEAINYFESATQIDPECIEAYISKADVYVTIGEIEKALVYLYDAAQKTENPEINDRFEELKAAFIWDVCYVTESGVVSHSFSKNDSTGTLQCDVCGFDSGIPAENP